MQEIVDLQQNLEFFLQEIGPRYSYQNFIPGKNHGSPYNKMENLAPTLRILGNLGGSFGMGRPQMGKGNT